MTLLLSFILCFGNALSIEPVSSIRLNLDPAAIYEAVLAEDDKIYFTAILEPRVFVCDLAGNTYPPIGQAGEGPFEFRLPMALHYDMPYLYVMDNGRRMLYQIDTSQNQFTQEWRFRPNNDFSVYGTDVYVSLSELERSGDWFNSTPKVMIRTNLEKIDETVAAFYDNPGYMDIKGTKRGAITRDSKGQIWAAYTGEYRIEIYRPDGKRIKSITRAPVGFEAPVKLNVNRFDKKALKDHYVSFDKIGQFIQVDNHTMALYRFKQIDDGRLDLFDLNGNVKQQNLKISGMVPFGVKDGKLYCYRAYEGNADYDLDIVAVDLNNLNRL